MNICTRCNRETRVAHNDVPEGVSIITIQIVHSGYGCDTGCCGYVIEGVTDDRRYINLTRLMFSHDLEMLQAEAAHLAGELSAEYAPELDERTDHDY